ncbi:heteromeric transposase endonuclease subunit TnsA [Gracilibacillus lacisalsi]|uniref:heteromeric transposase endonuclease subunit TnsA n=1 Tax=Gracilibacillus lacisalsi TaxID=393087 RepID=UPI00037AEA0B|nr:heteromeric transposase endonuclease subunit TnsA [Gracilibacillus lacisalsi]
MGKRKYGWTENKIAKYIKEGRGSGELGSYKPWLTIHDVPSRGNSSRIKGWKTGRNHHFFSNIERNYFYLLEWSEAVLDVREQFPLNRTKTLEIAENKGIKHIKDNKNNTFIPVTTDVVITIRRNNQVQSEAISIKPSEHLEDNDVLDKLEIEREYWKQQEINWLIVTERDLPSNLTRNIQWIHPFRIIEKEQVELANTFLKYLNDTYNKNQIVSIFDLITAFEEDYILNAGTGVNYFRYLLANKVVSINMNEKLDLRKRTIHDLSINHQKEGIDYFNASSK